MFIFGIPLSFFLPLAVHAWSGLATGVTGVMIPLLDQLPPLTFWVLPTLIGLPFIILSLSRFVPKTGMPLPRSRIEREKQERYDISSFKEDAL